MDSRLYVILAMAAALTGWFLQGPSGLVLLFALVLVVWYADEKAKDYKRWKDKWRRLHHGMKTEDAMSLLGHPRRVRIHGARLGWELEYPHGGWLVFTVDHQLSMWTEPSRESRPKDRVSIRVHGRIPGFRFLYQTDDPNVAVVRIPTRSGFMGLLGNKNEWIIRRGDNDSIARCLSEVSINTPIKLLQNGMHAALDVEIQRWEFPELAHWFRS